MTYKFISVLFGLVVLLGCGGSQSLKKDLIATPYKFIAAEKTEIYEETWKGGNDDSFLEEDEFIPHPLIPLEEISNYNRRASSKSSFYVEPMHDLGVEIEQNDNRRINPSTLYVADPMLESIRQDLMIKWGIDEPVIKEINTKTKTIADIESKLSKIENSIKGDLAALRSENLMLVSRLQDLERQVNSSNARVKKTNKPSQKTKITPKSAPPKLSYKKRYDSALSYYRLRKFDSAIRKFKSLTLENKSHSLADNAQYWIGECYYHLKFYSKAVSAFEKVLAFDDSNKKDSAILMKGKALKHLGLKKDAIEQFKALIAQYPRSAYTKRARELISTMEKG